jgi:chemotaxis protein MotB
MALSLRRRGGNGLEAWPGYVDALSTLLMVTIFVLLVFVLAEAFMSAALTGSNNTIASLKGEIAQLSQVLSLQKSKVASLDDELASMAALVRKSKAHNASLTTALAAAGAAKAKAQAALASLSGKETALEAALSDAKAQGNAATSRIAGLQASLAAATANNAPSYKTRLASANKKLAAQTQLSVEATRQIDLLNQQIAALRLQLSVIAAALDAESAKSKAQKVKIADLGKQLNEALARKVRHLQLYRSEFFGTLRKILAGQKNIKIVGDRFVFESDVLFPSDQATLSAAGQRNIADVAKAIEQIAGKIPPGLKWALSVDGFADQAAIHGGPYKDNFDLSAARALAVLHELVKDGVSKKHVLATAYGAEHPIAKGKTPANFARDRRIEFRLTSAD